MMQNAPSSYHAAGRNNDARSYDCVDLLRFFRSRGKGESGPLEGRAILANHFTRAIAVFLVVLEEDLDCLDGHRTVAEHRQSRDLPRFHQVLEDENEFLCSLNGEGGHD